MNREERLLFLLADDKMNKTSRDEDSSPNMGSESSDSESIKRQFKLDKNIPVLPEQKISNPYQTATVENNNKWVDVCTINVEEDKAAHITQIANDWYPDMTFELRADGITVEGNIQRQVAPTNDPQSANIIVSDKLVWRAFNNGSKNRDVAAVADGKFVSDEVYDKLIEKKDEKETESFI